MNSVIVAAFVLIYFSVTLFLCRGIRLNAGALSISGITVALTLVLESIRIPLPTGATAPLFSMVPLMLLALVYGSKIAFCAGWVCGIMAMLLIPGWQPIHIGQVFVEQMICLSCLGYAGIFGSDRKWKILCGCALASVLKITSHLLSGVLFFSQNAWDGWGAWAYSLSYNLSQNVPLSILSTLVVVSFPIQTLKKAVERRK